MQVANINCRVISIFFKGINLLIKIKHLIVNQDVVEPKLLGTSDLIVVQKILQNNLL